MSQMVSARAQTAGENPGVVVSRIAQSAAMPTV